MEIPEHSGISFFDLKNDNNLMINIKKILTNEYMERMMKLQNIQRRRYLYGKTKENGKKSLCMEIL